MCSAVSSWVVYSELFERLIFLGGRHWGGEAKIGNLEGRVHFSSLFPSLPALFISSFHLYFIFTHFSSLIASHFCFFHAQAFWFFSAINISICIFFFKGFGILGPVAVKLRDVHNQTKLPKFVLLFMVSVRKRLILSFTGVEYRKGSYSSSVRTSIWLDQIPRFQKNPLGFNDVVTR